MSLKYAVTIRSVELSMKTGEYLKAYDQAEAGLALYPEDKQLQYFAVLSLARQGATEQAQNLYSTFDLGRSEDGSHAALGARLIKDHALGDYSKQRLNSFLKAAVAQYIEADYYYCNADPLGLSELEIKSNRNHIPLDSSPQGETVTIPMDKLARFCQLL